ncbi:hypothetical protein KSS87_014111 [Heliosperma pusillum]|nr:hypothetical protein KSS87_014111 [Heliosperma pusillum]
MELDEDRVAHRARLDDLSNDSYISSENVEVIMPQSTVVLPVSDSSLIQDGLQGFLNSEPILPNQGIPLQEPDEPFIHPDTGDTLFPVVFEDLSSKKRKRPADIWNHFKFYKSISKNGPEKMYALCIYCRKAIFRAESKCGTSNFTRHIMACVEKKKQPCEETKITKEFDQNVYVELMAEAIMMHGYPFSIVEHRGLRRVHLYLNENVQTISRNSIKKVCLLKHVEFKEKIKQMLGALSSKICLTCDVWTACTSRAYLTLTAHYVDNKWTLRSKVLNFVHFSPPHTGFRTFSLLLPLLQDWGIEKNIFTLTLDNASSNDSMALDMYTLDESGFKHRISGNEWLKVEKICSLLEPFYEITNAFSGCEYPTANLYFINIFKIQRLLLLAIDGGDTNIRTMATSMYDKFEKYWHEFSPILSFAVILDPRYKYDFVLYALKKLHGELTGTNKANVIYVQFLELYKNYEKTVIPIPTTTVNQEENGCGDLEDFDACYGSSQRFGVTEHEKYLSDRKEPRLVQIDVLSFWAKNVDKYPILASMAKDILAIPITTVASESTFSMGGRILNKWRSSLLSQNVEALVTTRNWLFGYEELDQLGVEVGQDGEDW